MEWPTPLIEGTLLKRYKRFFADIELADGTVVVAHCPNTGSMRGCAVAGSPVYISPSNNPKRKLAYTWEAVQRDGAWVGVHTGRANGIVAEAIEQGRIPELLPYDTMRPEVKYADNSRIDLLLTHNETLTYVEVKNTTLAADGLASFPDSVTTRGQKHMQALAQMVAEGHRAAVVFLVHRDDCERFTPADSIDPDYGVVLRKAFEAGVMVLPYQATVTQKEVVVNRLLPIDW